MRIPVVQGMIERRVLVNYRVDPRAIAPLLPPPFRPQLVGGFAVAGICLIRLSEVRPRWVPVAMGLSSENAAHRIAVEWEFDGRQRTGVYIPRRDTSSRFNAAVGGRLFPGEHNPATFRVHEEHSLIEIQMESNDRQAVVGIRARESDALESSVFANLDHASAFFKAGGLGYSATGDAGRFDGLELRCTKWAMQALSIEWARSSFFENPAVFSPGAAELDCALIMRNIPHEWRGQPDLCCIAAGSLLP